MWSGTPVPVILASTRNRRALAVGQAQESEQALSAGGEYRSCRNMRRTVTRCTVLRIGKFISRAEMLRQVGRSFTLIRFSSVLQLALRMLTVLM